MADTLAAARAELTKLRRVRGTFAALLLFVPLTVLVAALDGWSARNAIDSRSPLLRPGFPPRRRGWTASATGSSR